MPVQATAEPERAKPFLPIKTGPALVLNVNPTPSGQQEFIAFSNSQSGNVIGINVSSSRHGKKGALSWQHEGSASVSDSEAIPDFGNVLDANASPGALQAALVDFGALENDFDASAPMVYAASHPVGTPESPGADRGAPDMVVDLHSAMTIHDMRTPLTSVRAYLDMLIMGVYGTQNDRSIRGAELALRGIGRVERLLADLLGKHSDAEPLDREKGEQDQCDYMLFDLIADEIALLEHASCRKSIRIDFQCQVNSVYASHDAHLLRRVLSNLLTNAIKFSPEGSCINVIAERLDAKFLKISVSDRGCGISLKDRESIFEPFVQSQPSLVHDSSGDGLGLTICKQIVDRLGGKIGLLCSLGSGSYFWFTIPG